MEQYTIYCTKGQTNKALELGAPIEVDFQFNYKTVIINKKAYIVPTAEQMTGWLRKEKGLFVELYLNCECCYSFYPIVSTKEDGEIIQLEAEDDPDMATIVAIDAALEYLTNNKK